MKKILVAVDGSEKSKKAAQEAANIAKCMLAEVTLIHIYNEKTKIPINQFEVTDHLTEDTLKQIEIEQDEKIKKSKEKIVNEALKEFKEKGIKPDKVVLRGNPADTICDYAAENDFDMIIVADKGHGGVERFLMGSTSDKIVRHAKSSVFVIR